MRILVTGSNGQVGQAVRKRAEKSDHEFLFTDRTTMDIVNEEEVRDVILGFKPKVIVNAAAYTAVDKAEVEQDLCSSVNAGSLNFLLNASKELSEEAFIIHISTDYIYHPDHSNVITEDEPTNPQSVYATTKLEGENVLRHNSNHFMILRTSWVYDEDGHNFVNTMLRLGEIKDSLSVVQDQVGSPTYAADIAEVIFRSMTLWEEAPNTFDLNKVFNFSNEGFTNWAEFAKEIMALGGYSCAIHGIPSSEYPTAAARPLNSRLSKNLIKKVMGIEIPSWQASLAKCIQNKRNSKAELVLKTKKT